MQTTRLIVEHVVIGVIVSLALGVLFYAVFPDEMGKVMKAYNQWGSPLTGNSAVFAVIAISVIYALGVLSESVGEVLFEKLLMKPIQMKRHAAFVEKRREMLSGSAVGGSSLPRIGQMRFRVLSESEPLYGLIERQMNRFRLTRVLPLVIAFLAAAIAIWCWQDPSMFLCAVLAVTLIAFGFSLRAVFISFDHYCRDVLRSYEVLVLDPASGTRSVEKRPIHVIPTRAVSLGRRLPKGRCC